MTGIDEQGAPIKLEDPRTSSLQPIAKKACGKIVDSEAVSQMLTSALGESAASWPQLTTNVSRWLVAIKTRGMVSALAEALAESPIAPVSDTKVVGGGEGADLAMVPGSSTAQTRLAVLKLRQARIQADLHEVSVHLEVARQEAIDEMEIATKEATAKGGSVIKRLGSKPQLPRSRTSSSSNLLEVSTRAMTGSTGNLQSLAARNRECSFDGTVSQG